MLGGNGLNSTQMYAVAGPASEGVVVGAAWFIGGKENGNLEFVKRFKTKYGNDPDQFAAQAMPARKSLQRSPKRAQRQKKKFSPGSRAARRTPRCWATSASMQSRCEGGSGRLADRKGGFAPF